MTESLAEAIELQKNGEPLKAIDIYRRILDDEPENADVWHLSGVAAHQAGEHALADELVGAAISLDGGKADYHSNRGMIQKALEDMPAAEASLARALEIDPGHVKALANMAGILRMRGAFADAVALARRATSAGPIDADAHNNLGNALADLGRPQEACVAFRRAIAIDADFAVAHWNYSLALLLLGDYPAGFKEMAWRWRWRGFPAPRRNFSQTLWDGREFAGETLLVHAEQGLGDAIQFVRYAALAGDRAVGGRAVGGRVIVECPAALVSLIEAAKLCDQVVAGGAPLPDFDCHAPFLDLPRILETSTATIPAQVPYLAVDAAAGAAWRQKTQELGNAGDVKIGLNWAGNAKSPVERFRRLPAGGLAALAGVGTVSWFSLQKEPGAEVPPPPDELRVIDTGPAPLSETAALIANLDLVITSDTAIAHLAGALARPVWLLLHHAPDWRWLLGRPDSPWYPTMRLFRQSAPGAWDGVFAEVARALETFVQERL